MCHKHTYLIRGASELGLAVGVATGAAAALVATGVEVCRFGCFGFAAACMLAVLETKAAYEVFLILDRQHAGLKEAALA